MKEQEQHYRTPRRAITKADKIFNSMLKTYKLRDSMRVQKKADKGVSVLKGAIK